MSIPLVSKSEMTVLTKNACVGEHIIMGIFFILFGCAWIAIGACRICGRSALWFKDWTLKSRSPKDTMPPSY